MRQDHIEYLKALDPEAQYGTLQRVMQEGDLSSVPFEKLLTYLVEQLMIEKATLVKENTKYIKVLKDNGLYTSELILGE